MLNILNTRILLSIASIAAAITLVVGATFAFFSDTNSSTANVFAAGTLDLQLDDVNEASTSSSISASFGGTNMAPGTSTSGFISLHNNGSIAMAEVELATNQTNNTNNGDGSDLADVLDISILKGDDSTCTTNQSNLTGTLATALGNGLSPLTLTEMNNGDYDAFPGLAAVATYFLCFTGTMQSSAGNAYQGDSITEDFVFTANQDASQ